MPFDYDLSEALKKIVLKLRERDPTRCDMLWRKINQIIQCDEFTIDHFKNLQHGMKDRKRVHVDKRFVLTFKVDKAKKFILFDDFDHHNAIYKK